MDVQVFIKPIKDSPILLEIKGILTNDVNECKELADIGCSIIILDHHIADTENPYAIIINDQTSDYPNKELSGVGVVWQFCRYVDSQLGKNFADNYLDLVAVGDQGDMMDLRSIETSYLIRKGLEDENIHNPFLFKMVEKNRFSIGNELTPMGASFYIVPFVNAMVRSGTMDEKQVMFQAMLSWTAFNEVPSTKRGHKPGDTEKICDQAVRITTNVKARQTKAQDAAVEVMKKKIEDQHLLDHKVLLFLLEPGEIDKNIAGLIANKVMAKYQRPVCILTKTIDKEGKYGQINMLATNPPQYDYPIIYQGSMRGCSIVGVDDFKSICEATKVCQYVSGHANAAGVGILKQDIPTFIEKTDDLLKNMTDEPIYYVDYIWDRYSVSPEKILDISNLSHYWGMGVDEPEIAIENITVSPDMISVYEKRGITIKIQMDDISLLLFNAKEEDKEKLKINNTGYVKVNIVGRCNRNVWMGKESAQIFISDYEIVDSNEYYF